MGNTTQKNIPSINKIIKYLLLGFLVVVYIRYIPEFLLSLKETIMIAALTSISYAIMDMVSPTVKLI